MKLGPITRVYMDPAFPQGGLRAMNMDWVLQVEEVGDEGDRGGGGRRRGGIGRRRRKKREEKEELKEEGGKGPECGTHKSEHAGRRE